jgi:hypothetical protein
VCVCVCVCVCVYVCVCARARVGGWVRICERGARVRDFLLEDKTHTHTQNIETAVSNSFKSMM